MPFDISTDRRTNRLTIDLTGRMEREILEDAVEETSNVVTRPP